MRAPLLPLTGVFLALVLVATACGSDAQVAAPDPTAAPTSAVPATAVPAATATSVPATLPPQPEPTPTAAAPATPPAAVPTSPADLPGEPWDLFVPALGETIAVVGVSFDDILEVHEFPGENTALVGTLAPTADDVRSAGEGRQLSRSFWWRITQGDVDGWVGSRFMSRLGVTLDITSEVITAVGETPTAETMLELGMIVANERASEDPPSRMAISVAPTVGDLGEITIDVVDFPDDAVGGERLHIFGQPLDSGEGFSLKAVEATVMCRRGVTTDGLCL